ncbi:MAG: haloacid dehalogenase-like hydrolase [Cyclobacteriaceae bacterium]|nr:haloacid dehalogenase-like hydrolase [Cyclobacteriaceae bacterium]
MNTENSHSTRKHKLVLFDFDGTLTHKDTLFEFTRYAVGNARFIFGLMVLALPLVLQKLKVVTAQQAKEIFLSHYFGNTSLEDFNALCNSFCAEVLPSLIRHKAMDAILQHQKEGGRIIIISASPANWIRPWASKYKIETIATELEIQNNRLTGKIAGANCNGEEKVNRLKAMVDITQYDTIIAYGDTAGDLPMLNLANKKFFKPFR